MKVTILNTVYVELVLNYKKNKVNQETFFILSDIMHFLED